MVNKRNLHKELLNNIECLNKHGQVKKLLVHACCAPCSSYCLEFLRENFILGVFFYNPNIDNNDEYIYRLNEMKKMIDLLNEGIDNNSNKYIRLYEGDYNPELYHKLVKGHEKDPEGGERCSICFNLRLTEAAKKTRELSYDYFTTSLSISPMKDAQLLCSIGEEAAKIYDVSYMPSDFKKNNGYLRSVELSKEFDLYRQDYCGCSFSKAESLRRREEKNKGIRFN